MEGIHIGIVSLAALICLVPVALVWYVTGGSVYLAVKKALQKSKQRLTCFINSDCPAGHICIDGNCIPAK